MGLLFHPEGIYRAVGNTGLVRAGGGVFAVDVEGPVHAVLVIVGGDAVDGLDVQTVAALLAGYHAQLL